MSYMKPLQHRTQLPLLAVIVAANLLAGCGSDDGQEPAEPEHTETTRNILGIEGLAPLDDPTAAVEASGPEPDNANTVDPSAEELREVLNAPRARGPRAVLVGKIVSRSEGLPIAGCSISSDGFAARSGEDGTFALEGVRTGGRVRLRFRCAGRIERTSIVIASGAERVEWEAPFAFGHGEREQVERPSVTEQIRRAGSDDEAENGGGSSLRRIAAGAAHIAGGAAAVSSAGEPDRYRLLGHLDRAEIHDEYDRTPASPEQGSARLDDGATLEAVRPSSGSNQSVEPSAVVAEAPGSGTAVAAGPQRTEHDEVSGPAFDMEWARTIDGPLGAAEIDGEMRSRAYAIYYCYGEEMQQDHDLRVGVRATWTIGTDGLVQQASVEDASLDDDDARACVLRRLLALDFPPADAPTRIAQTFVFNIWEDPREPFRGQAP